MTDWRLQVVVWCRNHFNVLLTTFSTFFIAASAFSIYMEFDQAYLEADFRVWLAIISCKLFLKLVLTWSLTLTKSNSSGTTHASSLKSAISFVDWFGLIWFFIGHLLLLMNLDGLHTFPFLFACVCAYLAYMYAYYTCTLALYLHLGSYPPVSQEDRDLLDTLGVAICLDGNHTSSSNPRVTRRQEGKRKSLAHSTAPLYREKWQAWLAQRGCTERRGDSGEDIEMGGGGGEGDTALCAICLHPLAVAMPTRTSPLSPAPRTASSSSSRCCDASVPEDANPSVNPYPSHSRDPYPSAANPSAAHPNPRAGSTSSAANPRANSSAANLSTNPSAANPSDPSAGAAANPSSSGNPGSSPSASATNPNPSSANPSPSANASASASVSAGASASAIMASSRDWDEASGAVVVSFPCHRSSASAEDGRTAGLPHEFHAACLHTWLHTQHAQQQQRQRLRTSTSTSSGGVEGEEGLLTCPVCRQPPRCRSRGVGNKGTSAGALVDAGAADGGDVV